jgi:polyhydroxyalkanoate synthesis regulator phasin
MPAAKSSSSARTSSARSKSSPGARQATQASGANIASLVEQLVNRVLRPLDLIMISRDRIQDTLDEAAERGRLTRSDANDLVSELVRRGREQTDSVLADIERLLLGRGRSGSTAKLTTPVEKLVRGAGRVKRSVSGGLPIIAYDELTARQATERLKGLTPAELRQVRDYEHRHANRKSVLAAIERELSSD